MCEGGVSLRDGGMLTSSAAAECVGTAEVERTAEVEGTVTFVKTLNGLRH